MTGVQERGAARELETLWPFARLLPGDAQALLAARCMTRRYARGALVDSQDGGANGLMFINAGTLRVCVSSREGRFITLYRLRAGDVCLVTATGTFPELRFDAVVLSDSAATLTVLADEDFSRLMQDNRDVRLWAYHTLAQRFSRVIQAMRRVLLNGLDRRLALCMMEEYALHGTPLRITQESLARNASSAREAVTRMLRAFAAKGLVRYSRGRIDILNPEALRALAGEGDTEGAPAPRAEGDTQAW